MDFLKKVLRMFTQGRGVPVRTSRALVHGPAGLSLAAVYLLDFYPVIGIFLESWSSSSEKRPHGIHFRGPGHFGDFSFHAG